MYYTDEAQRIMTRTEHLEGYGLFRNGWKIKEIAIELSRSQPTIQAWRRRFHWDDKLAADLRDIEEEMKDKIQKAREKIIDIGTQTLDDVFIRDTDGNVVGVKIQIEDIKDFKLLTETILKTGGVPDRVEQKTETTIKGDLNVKTETIDPEMAAEVGKALALKASMQTVVDE